MPEASIGRIVHFVLNNGPFKGSSRPAQIVNVFPQTEGPPVINVVVTLDGSNDYEAGEGMHQHGYVRGDADAGADGRPRTFSGPVTLHRWETSVPHAEAVGRPATYPPGTWHWPEGVG